MEDFQDCIDACLNCAMECDRNTSFCIEIAEEAHVQLILLGRDCADICLQCARLISRESLFTQSICELCADICEATATECDKFSDHEPCRRCAIACRACAEECRKIASRESL